MPTSYPVYGLPLTGAGMPVLVLVGMGVVPEGVVGVEEGTVTVGVLTVVVGAALPGL